MHAARGAAPARTHPVQVQIAARLFEMRLFLQLRRTTLPERRADVEPGRVKKIFVLDDKEAAGRFIGGDFEQHCAENHRSGLVKAVFASADDVK
jgi:hypothetical protein